MLTCNAAIFDMDGTLIDSLADLADSANDVMAHFGCPAHTLEEYRYFVGNGAKKLMERALPEKFADDAATVDEATALYKKFYIERHLLNKTKPYDGILPMLEKLRGSGVPLAVLTNKPHEAACLVAEKLFGAGMFCYVMGGKEGRPRKPDPRGALDLAYKLDILPRNIAYFGDSDADMLVAVNAGFLPVGVLWGFRPREELATNGAKIFLRQPMEIFDYAQFVKKQNTL